MTQTELILVFGVNGLISFIMLTIGIISYVRVKKFLASAIETRGTVVQSVFKGFGDDGSGSMYSPQIRFTDRMGKEYEFTENWSSNRPDYKIGDEVIVLYDPARPQKARRGGKKWKFFFIAWLFGGLGILFSGILLFFVIIMLFVPLL
ncbi:MAG TPA: DUF3592 domain-containing protein [Ignavibacteria bacterium]|nr:DUF3592 domain-containing protein [Ignavibacteria bacterium]HMQ99548.1 DUF3592 domain-containing protein [Ignavibacteria bacterium]